MTVEITETLTPNDTSATIVLSEAFEGKPAYAYSWEWADGSAPQGLVIDEVSAEEIQVQTVNALGGLRQAVIRAIAIDQLGQRAYDTITLNITVPRLAIGVSGSIIESLDPTETGLTTVTATGSEGLAPYTYSFAWEVVPDTGVVLETVGADGVRVRTSLARGGTYIGVIRATVTDALGQTAFTMIPVSVIVPPLAISLTLSAITESLEETGTGTDQVDASATEGVAPYTFAFAWVNRTSTGLVIRTVDADSIGVDTLRCHGGTNTGQIRATVTDAIGQTASADISVEVVVPVLAVTLSPDITANLLEGDESALITATVVKGVTPYVYSFTWDTQPSDLSFSLASANTGNIDVADPAADGLRSGVLRVTVTDDIGQVVTDTIAVEITVTSVPLPEVFMMNARVGPSWASTYPAPDGIVAATDLVVSWDGHMGFFSDTRYNAYNAGSPQLANRTVTYPAGIVGSSSAAFGNRQPDNDLPIYAMMTLAIGTLSSSADFSVGLQSGGGTANNYGMVYGLRNVARTSGANRVIGAANSPLTGGPFTTVTVPGVTAPADNSILMMFSNCYSANGWWFEDGTDEDEWNYPIQDFVGPGLSMLQMQWKLVPAGATGDITFTRRFPFGASEAAQSVYKRVAFFVCIEPG